MRFSSPQLQRSADWAVITEYIEALKPPKEATKRLEAHGGSGRFGATYDVIPIFEYVLAAYEALLRDYNSVNHNDNDAPEDHLRINLRAGWHKLSEYYAKLDASPAYYAAVCLHLD